VASKRRIRRLFHPDYYFLCGFPHVSSSSSFDTVFDVLENGGLDLNIVLLTAQRVTCPFRGLGLNGLFRTRGAFVRLDHTPLLAVAELTRIPF
jgi:hypothetical protein